MSASSMPWVFSQVNRKCRSRVETATTGTSAACTPLGAASGRHADGLVAESRQHTGTSAPGLKIIRSLRLATRSGVPGLVDEVHQAAPSSRGRYATDSQRTTLLRTLARRSLAIHSR